MNVNILHQSLSLPDVNVDEIRPLFDLVAAPMMVIDVTPERVLRYRLMNKAAEAFFSILSDDYRGKEIKPYRGPDQARSTRRDQTMAAYLQCVESHQPVSLEIDHVTVDGEHRYGQHQIVPVIEDGRVTQLMVTSIDVTELVRTRESLNNALTRTLSDYLTICACCKNIQTDEDWMSIEAYADRRMDFRKFSHGLCPSCVEKQIEDL